MIRILQVVSGLDGGGVETMLYNYYMNMNREIVKFDFAVHDPNIGILEQKFKELGCNIYHVTPKKVSIFKNVKDINNIMKLGKYDIVHCHQNMISLVPLFIAKMNRIVIRIAHSHVGFIDQSISSKILEMPFKALTRRYSTEWFACSNIAKKWLYGEKKNKNVVILNNAIDLGKFQYNNDTRQEIRREFGWEDKFVVGNVARFYPEKNHELVVKIFEEIYKQNPLAILVLVGAEGENDKIRTQVEELDLTKCVFFLGVRNDVEKLMQAMDVFLLPSIFEGLGMVFIEAQAAGLKCFASNIVPRETEVTDLIEYIGLEKTPKFWAARVINSQNNYLRKNTYEFMQSSNFDIKKESKKLEGIYCKLFNGTK